MSKRQGMSPTGSVLSTFCRLRTWPRGIRKTDRSDSELGRCNLREGGNTTARSRVLCKFARAERKNRKSQKDSVTLKGGGCDTGPAGPPLPRSEDYRSEDT